MVELCAEPGEYTYSTGTQPSLLSGGLKDIDGVFAEMGKRFGFGGQAAADQRIYYINTKELVGNKYGTPNPVPFRVVDQRAGIDLDIAIRCFGEYSYRIVNPILFYTNVCGNVENAYTRDAAGRSAQDRADDRPAACFCRRISEQGIRYSSLPAHTTELADALNQALSAKWSKLRGIEIVSLGVSGVKASEEDEQMIKDLQRSAAFMDPTRAAAHLVGAQAAAMQAAASNTAAGPAMAFMGVNQAAAAGGVNAQTLYQMGAQQPSNAGRPGFRLGLLLRPDRQHRQVLHRLRQAPARSAHRLGVQLRCKEQRQILFRMRQAEACRQVPELRLHPCRPGPPAEVLPGMRQPLRRIREAS